MNKHKLRHKPPGGFICSECGARFVTDAERVKHRENIHTVRKNYEHLKFKIIFIKRLCLFLPEFQMFDMQWKMRIGGYICRAHKSFAQWTRPWILHVWRLWRRISTKKSTKVWDFDHSFRLRMFIIFFSVLLLEKNRLHSISKCGTVRCYSCNQCDAKFMTQNTLNAHLYVLYLTISILGISIFKFSILFIFRLIHTGQKKHRCKFCGNSFLSRGQLKIHERYRFSSFFLSTNR